MVSSYIIALLASTARTTAFKSRGLDKRGSKAHKQPPKLLSIVVFFGVALGFAASAGANPAPVSALQSAKNSLQSWASTQSRSAQRQLVGLNDSLERSKAAVADQIANDSRRFNGNLQKLSELIVTLEELAANESVSEALRNSAAAKIDMGQAALSKTGPRSLQAEWPLYIDQLTKRSLYTPSGRVDATKKWIAALDVFTRRVAAAKNLVELKSIKRPSPFSPPNTLPALTNDPMGRSNSLIATVDALVKELDLIANPPVPPTSDLGLCKFAGGEDHDEHPHGHHEMCGCENGVVTVHGQSMKLPETTRVISGRTRMSDLLPLLKDEEVLEIDHDATLEYDVTSDLRLRAVVVYGALEFTPTVDTKMIVGDLIVAPTGRLTVGTEDQPIASDKKAEIVLADYAFDRNTDPYQLRNAIIALGEVTMHGRPVTNPGIRLAQAPKAGDRSLLLKEAPEGWRLGDTVVLADTRQLPKQNRNFFSQTEYVTITAIDGLNVALDRALSFAHPGILLPDIKGNLTVPIQIEAINTTRNIVVRSLQPVGMRGHTMFADRAKIDLRYASFVDLGRTASGEFNNTQCNHHGELMRFGSNQIGRYPIHTHFLLGRENPSNQGYQFTMLGLNVEGSRRWAIAIHDSSFGLISKNVLHRISGDGLAFESGNESYNDVIGNLFVGSSLNQVIKPEDLLSRGGKTRSDVDGTTSFSGNNAIWDSPSNTITDNRMYGAWQIGYQLNHYWETGITTPKYRGADPADSGSHITWAARTNDDNGRTDPVSVGQKRANLIWGANVGVYLAWPRGGDIDISRYEKTPGVYERFIIANVQEGVHSYHTDHDRFIDFVMVNDPIVANQYLGDSRYSVGFNFNHRWYEAANMKILSENASAVFATPEGAVDSNGVYAGTYVANFHVGFDSLRHARTTARPGAFSPESDTEVRGGMWRNWVNFRINLAFDHVARVTRIGEVATDEPSEMKPIPGFPARSLNVLMNYDLPNITGTHVLTKDSVFLENWTANNLTAPNFRMYYLQQTPDFIVPQSSNGPVRIVGASEANLTNEAHRVRYGSSIGGSLAPCGGRGISCAELQSRGQPWRIHGLVEDRP